MRRIQGVLTAAFVLLGAGNAFADGFSWVSVADAVVARLDEAVQAVRKGSPEEAKRAINDAYFGVFETRKFEAAMRKELGHAHTYATERQFGTLRKAAGSGEPADKLAAAVAAFGAALREDARKLDAAGIPADVYAVD